MFEEEPELFEINENPETDYLIDSIHSKKNSLAYGLYSKLIAYQNHYHVIQNKYKRLAATWIVATFIGLGYLATVPNALLLIDNFITGVFLCILAAQGIFLLWLLDDKIYHRILGIIFIETLKLEKAFPILGKSYQNMALLQKGPSQKFHGIFYKYLMFFLLITSILTTGLFLFPQLHHPYFGIAVVLILTIFLFTLLHGNIFKSKKKKNLSKLEVD